MEQYPLIVHDFKTSRQEKKTLRNAEGKTLASFAQITELGTRITQGGSTKARFLILAEDFATIGPQDLTVLLRSTALINPDIQLTDGFCRRACS